MNIENMKENKNPNKKMLSLDDIIENLSRAKENGQSVYYDYDLDGKTIRLFSDDIDADKAYMEVYGITREEFAQKSAEQMDSLARSILEDEGIDEKIPEWEKSGEEIIFPEKHEAWKNFVDEATSSLYRGPEVMATLAIMEELETGKPIEAVLESIKNNRLTRDYDRVSQYVFQFSNRGPEFLENITPPDKMTPELMLAIENQKRTNSELDQKHSKEIPTK